MCGLKTQRIGDCKFDISYYLVWVKPERRGNTEKRERGERREWDRRGSGR